MNTYSKMILTASLLFTTQAAFAGNGTIGSFSTLKQVNSESSQKQNLNAGEWLDCSLYIYPAQEILPSRVRFNFISKSWYMNGKKMRQASYDGQKFPVDSKGRVHLFSPLERPGTGSVMVTQAGYSPYQIPMSAMYKCRGTAF